MDIYHIGSDPFRNLGLIFEFLDGFLHHVGSGRVQNHELIGMEARPDFICSGELTARFESSDDLVAVRKIGKLRSRTRRVSSMGGFGC